MKVYCEATKNRKGVWVVWFSESCVEEFHGKGKAFCIKKAAELNKSFAEQDRRLSDKENSMKYLTEENLVNDRIVLQDSVRYIIHRVQLSDIYHIEVLIKQPDSGQAWGYVRVGITDGYSELVTYSNYFDTIDEAKEYCDLVVEMLMNNKDSKLFK